MQALDARATEQALRDFLGGFGFQGEQALALVEPFSGGEKARLALALLVWQRPNLLLLDEPTNHLDLEMRHALNLALQEYQGALIVVSHDRHLLRTTTDAFALVAEGRVEPFDGDLDDFREWLNSRQHESREMSEQRPSELRKERKWQEAERRQQLAVKRRPLEKRIRELELRLDRLHREKVAMETALADGDLYAEASKDRLKELLLRQGRLNAELGPLEEEWLALQEELEALVAEW